MGYDHSSNGKVGWLEPAMQNHSCDRLHPSVIVRDLRSRPHPSSHIIVFANEKGGVGKSTAAFHSCVALCDAGASVLAIDLDRRQHSLATGLESRAGTARCLGTDLPSPRYAVLQHQSGALLNQEILRLGSETDFVVIDVAGHDSPIARYAIALADTLVTPVNSSAVDLNALGEFDPVTKRLKQPGPFARIVTELRAERMSHGLPALDWVVIKNRMRAAERRQQIHTDHALHQLARALGFRLGHGLSERVAYRELFPFGLTHLDLKRIPRLARMQVRTEEEIHLLVDDLAVPLASACEKHADRRHLTPHKAKVIGKRAKAFDESLHAHMHSSALRTA